MNPVAVELVKRWEGCSLASYLDAGGVPTCGYGATGPDVTLDTVWTQGEADARLRADLQSALDTVRLLVAKPLTINQEAALASFVFNLGAGTFSKSTLLRKLRDGDEIGTALEFTKWHHVGQKPLKGLLRRRLDEAGLFLRP